MSFIDIIAEIGQSNPPETARTAPDGASGQIPLQRPKTQGNAPERPQNEASEIIKELGEKTDTGSGSHSQATQRKITASRQAAEAYKEYQDNIKKAEMLKAEIAKGVQEGDSRTALLLKAIKCISLMTGDKVFYITLSNILNN